MRTVELYSLGENELITLEEAAWILNNPIDPSDTFISLEEASKRYFGGKLSARCLAERVAVWNIDGMKLTTPKSVKEFKRSATDLMPTNGDVGVYIVGDARHVKIGISQEIGFRLGSLQRNSPRPIRLLCKFEGSLHQERALHACFAEYRLNGEWFERRGYLARWLSKLARSAR
jgi:hypothetical protein